MSVNSNLTDEPSNSKQATNPLLTVAAYSTAIVAILGLIGTLLSTAGYGVSLAVESLLGMPHAALFKSAFDLLDLSFWFMVQLINLTSDGLLKLFYTNVYWFTVFLVSAFCLLMWIAMFALSKAADYFKAKYGPVKPFRFHEQSEKKKFFIISGVVTFISAFGAMAIMPLLLVVILLASSVFGIIPVLTMAAGEAHIRDYVVSPRRCAPVLSREHLISHFNAPAKKKQDKSTELEKVAQCVKVTSDDGKLVGQGRVVFQTTAAVILFDPKTGKTARVPTDGKTVEVIDTL